MSDTTVMRPELDLPYFRSQLQEEHERLLRLERELADSSRQAKESLEGFSESDDVPADIAAQASEREKDQLLSQSVQHMLAQIDFALERIEDGSYGICEMCGVEIPDERLERLPYVSTCVDCQTAIEEG